MEKVKAKVLMCCSQSQLVLAPPGFLASGAYWVDSLFGLNSSPIFPMIFKKHGVDLDKELLDRGLEDS